MSIFDKLQYLLTHKETDAGYQKACKELVGGRLAPNEIAYFNACFPELKLTSPTLSPEVTNTLLGLFKEIEKVEKRSGSANSSVTTVLGEEKVRGRKLEYYVSCISLSPAIENKLVGLFEQQRVSFEKSSLIPFLGIKGVGKTTLIKHLSGIEFNLEFNRKTGTTRLVPKEVAALPVKVNHNDIPETVQPTLTHVEDLTFLECGFSVLDNDKYHKLSETAVERALRVTGKIFSLVLVLDFNSEFNETYFYSYRQDAIHHYYKLWKLIQLAQQKEALSTSFVITHARDEDPDIQKKYALARKASLVKDMTSTADGYLSKFKEMQACGREEEAKDLKASMDKYNAVINVLSLMQEHNTFFIDCHRQKTHKDALLNHLRTQVKAETAKQELQSKQQAVVAAVSSSSSSSAHMTAPGGPR